MEETRASEVVSSPVRTVDVDATVKEVLGVMLRHDIEHVPVLREGRVAGMVARHDLLGMLRSHLGD